MVRMKGGKSGHWGQRHTAPMCRICDHADVVLHRKTSTHWQPHRILTLSNTNFYTFPVQIRYSYYLGRYCGLMTRTLSRHIAIRKHMDQSKKHISIQRIQHKVVSCLALAFHNERTSNNGPHWDYDRLAPWSLADATQTQIPFHDARNSCRCVQRLNESQCVCLFIY